MATPQKPVYSLAIVEPKWVRAYVSEPDLGRVHPGMVASVTVDSFLQSPVQRLGGIYFTAGGIPRPRRCRRRELRTSLVYEVQRFRERSFG